MTRPIRAHRAGSTVHVFNRTLGQLYRLKPTPEMVSGIEAILIKQQRRHRMKVMAYVFMTNHFHLVLRIRHTHQLSRFMRDLQSAIALLSYDLFEGPRYFWERRYRSQELCTPTAIRRKVRYVSSHGAKEGIVSSPTAWAGPTCARQMKDPSKAPRVLVTDPKTGVERMHILELSRVPEDDGLPYPKWLKQQEALITSIEAQYAYGPFTGMERALAIPALWGPPQTRRATRARMIDWDCTGESGERNEAVFAEAKRQYELMVEKAAVAIGDTIRGGIEGIEYPHGCTFSHVIPKDLRRHLVGCADAGQPAVIRVPGAHPLPPRDPPGPRKRGPSGADGRPKPPD